MDSSPLWWKIIVIKVYIDSTPLQSNIVWMDLAVERVHWSPYGIWGGTDKTSDMGHKSVKKSAH